MGLQACLVCLESEGLKDKPFFRENTVGILPVLLHLGKERILLCCCQHIKILGRSSSFRQLALNIHSLNSYKFR